MNDLVAALDALARLPALVDRLALVLDRVDAEAAAPPLVTMGLLTKDQLAAVVRRSKRSLDHYRDTMPPPHVKGVRGRPALYLWADMRPWLEQTFGFVLPVEFPGNAELAERLRGKKAA